MITIIDCGMGNLRSVQKAFEHLGHAAHITTDPATVAKAEKLVLPGDGAFGDEMKNLREHHLDEAIQEFLKTGRRFLGICVGQQVLFEESNEFGMHAGLGLFPGQIRRLPDGLTVPHMGWNQIHIRRPSELLAGVASESFVYFIHSYYIASWQESDVVATTDYGAEFPVIVERDNIVATQFHPEKSQQPGLRMLKNFAEG